MDVRIKTPLPHGGKLVDRVVRDRERAKKMAKGAAVFDIKPTLYNGMPVRNVYREIMSICYGFFSPVEGSMTHAEVERVLKERRLLSNWIFPYPLVFDISREDYQKLGVTSGDRVLLRLKGQPFAILDVEEVYEIDPPELARRTFGTPEDNPEVVKKNFDEKHPGYVIYKSLNPIVLAGKYTIINEPKFRPPFDRFWFPPAKCREEFAKRGWTTVIAHQTRNVPHVGHEALLKNAAFTGDIAPCDGILVNCIIGAKRIGDYPDEAIVEAHEMVNKAGYVSPKRHMVTFTLWDMRYGNPLESLLHGIIRQNMGCTHHMFGRDHAAVGDYYDAYATQILWSKGIPSFGFPAPPNMVEYGLQIRPQNMAEFWYCPKCGETAYSANCEHAERQRFSGSFIRSLLAEGVFPPPVIMRPEVYKVVVKWWKHFNYPFNNKKYLIEREQRLEVDLEPLDI
ncbi:sulfate adenylyltransferase [Ammonifex degensii KC4]|uniref:sulfate adenylyltransferase n=1 Tax=Ammonifex degensii (strain DSM 10501 / KC4) TaxID=429009 RepID=C9R925_AMMDK|nr:sulfate adenylyltransferase [Ammonifex degensii]ACX52804.1 sulfate adenylyltransferase [Ammonifex degensii KC4]